MMNSIIGVGQTAASDSAAKLIDGGRSAQHDSVGLGIDGKVFTFNGEHSTPLFTCDVYPIESIFAFALVKDCIEGRTDRIQPVIEQYLEA